MITLTASAQPNLNSPFLWSAEKNGKTSYLFGTIHLPLPLNYISCSDFLLEKIRSSDLILLENLYNQNEMDRFFFQAVDTSHSSENEHEFKSLTPEIQNFLKEKNISNTNLTYIGYMLLLAYSMGQETFNSFDPPSIDIMDRQVKRIGQSQNIPLKALDSEANIKRLTDEQIVNMQHSVHLRANTDTITSIDLETAVYEYTGSILTQRRGITYFIKRYRSNDTHFFKNSPPKHIDTKFSLEQRNQEWLLKFIEAHPNYESIFIAVGIAHLTEQNNLIDMLTQEGFTVNRVNCD